MAVIVEEEVIFDSGKRVPAPNGVIGIGHGLRLFAMTETTIEQDGFSESEVAELCDLMIDRWRALRARLENHDFS